MSSDASILNKFFEIWTAVIGYESLYEVSNLGNVRSLTSNKVLKQGNSSHEKYNYKIVCLCKNGVKKTHFVHRLVAKSFIPNLDNKPFINHKDLNPSNNKMDNLEWCTQSENILHARHNGRYGKMQPKIVVLHTEIGLFCTIKEASIIHGCSTPYMNGMLHGKYPNKTKFIIA